MLFKIKVFGTKGSNKNSCLFANHKEKICYFFHIRIFLFASNYLFWCYLNDESRVGNRRDLLFFLFYNRFLLHQKSNNDVPTPDRCSKNYLRSPNRLNHGADILIKQWIFYVNYVFRISFDEFCFVFRRDLNGLSFYQLYAWNFLLFFFFSHSSSR